MSVKEMQEDFLEAVFSEDATRVKDYVAAGDISVAGLMDGYANNVLQGLVEVLRLTYPAVEKLVGADFFRQVAKAYAKAHKPESTNMDDYGAGFPEYLKTLDGLATLPFVPELACFERAVEEASVATYMKPVDKHAFGGVSPEALMQAKLQLLPSCQVIASEYPLQAIWEFAQKESHTADEKLDVSSGGGEWLICRPDKKVTVMALEKGEVTFLHVLSEHKTLYEAFEAADAENPNFSLENTLKRHMVGGVFCEVAL
jgi:hypothetical protein